MCLSSDSFDFVEKLELRKNNLSIFFEASPEDLEKIAKREREEELAAGVAGRVIYCFW